MNILVKEYEIKQHIFPYPTEVEIEMPRGTEVLSVQVNKGNLCVYGLSDIDEEKKMRKFLIAETGYRISDKDFGRLKHVGTLFMMKSGVFHLFEKIA